MRRTTRRRRIPEAGTDIVAKDYLGVSREELRVAIFEDSIAENEDNPYARSKALQSTGIAIELAYKALILAQGKTPTGTHKIALLHKQLRDGDEKTSIEKRILEVGWDTVSDWISFIDTNIDHPQRKYHMYDIKRQRYGIAFPASGAASVAGVKKVYDALFEVVDAKIEVSSRMVKKELAAGVAETTDVAPASTAQVGPLIAEINIPAGFAAEGEPLGGLVINPKSGEVRILKPDEIRPIDEE